MILVIKLISILLVYCVNTKIKSFVKIATYQPLTFELSFSQNIKIPDFQILVDNNNLAYTVLNKQNITNIYTIQVISDYQAIDTFNTESFSLIFNYPLDIQNGRLSLSDYSLSPQKTNLYITMSTWPVYFLYVLLLICSLFGILSLSVFDFVQICILTQLKFANKTSMIQKFSTLFFFDTVIQKQINYYLLRLITPTMIILSIYIFGLVVKKLSFYLIKNYSIQKRLVYFCSYNLFLTLWTISLPSIIFKSFQFIKDNADKSIQLNSQQYGLGIFITYLNFINFITYFYVLYFVLNPKINQDNKSFRNYMVSPQFQLYSKFHRGLHLRDWKKRNNVLFITTRKFIIIVLFFLIDNIALYVLALQLIGSFFIFTVRPYKDQFYTNLTIAFNMVWFFFYIIVLQGFFYYNISTTLQTRFSLTNFLIAKSILFYAIVFLGIIASCFQAYRLFKNLHYQFMQETEVKKCQNPIVLNRGRLYTQTSDKMVMDMKQSLIFDSPGSPQRKKRVSSNSSNKAKLSLFQIEMEDISSPVRKRVSSNKRINKKWKDKSLLQEIATN